MRWFPGMVVALALVTAGCEKSKARDARPTGAADAAAATALPCAQLDRAGCLASNHCTLVHLAPMKYECREEAGPCEVGVDQSDPRACAAVAGCVWEPSNCYCPSPGHGATAVPDQATGGADCKCGGGPPATCHAAATDAGPAATTDAALAALPCAQRDRAECLDAPGCTLVHVRSGRYECRDEVGACEVGVDQRDSRACDAVQGCGWDAGHCYCPYPGYGSTAVVDKEPQGGVACGCGGGPPPSCAGK